MNLVGWYHQPPNRRCEASVRAVQRRRILGGLAFRCSWKRRFHTWWLIPLSKWVITPVINGISRVNPLIVGVITCHNPLTKWDEPPSRPCKSREESLPKPYALRLWFGVGITKTIVISPPSWGKKGQNVAITSTNKPGETWFRTFGRFVSWFLFEIRDTEPTNKCKNDMWISPADYDYNGTMSTQCRHFKGDFSSKTWLKIGSRGIVSKQNMQNTSFKEDSLHSGLPDSTVAQIWSNYWFIPIPGRVVVTFSRSCWLLRNVQVRHRFIGKTWTIAVNVV